MTTILADGNTAEPRALAEAATPSAASAAPSTLAMAATFTAEPVEAPLRYMLDQAGLGFGIEFAAYHQVFQELLSPQSLLGRNSGGVNVVLVRLEDFVRDVVDDEAAELLARTLRELTDAIAQFARRSAGTLIVGVLAPSPGARPSVAQALQAATLALAASVRTHKGVLLIESADVDALCESTRYDEVADRLAHIPFTDAWFAALAIVVVRRVHMARVPAHKVLVLDCDNTIWQGVVGEDGPQGIVIDPASLAVQRFAVGVQAQGALVCLASKNVEADVMEVFATRPDMLLTPQHIVSHRVNWEAKAANLRSLARELNLGLDSFVFVDDNPVETGAMQELAPEVVTLQLPLGGDIQGFVDNLWAFDKVAITQEDARRTEMYRENSARDNFESQAGDIGEFLAALQLKIAIAAPADGDWPRLSQLTQRTNQFNFTTRRRTEAELRALAAAGDGIVLSVHVSDRFGDYGLVGLVVARRAPAELEIDTFLLSCRVLGRGVEHSILAHLGASAAERGLDNVRLSFIPTPKNEPARGFADSILAAYRVASPAGHDYVVPSVVMAAIQHKAGEDAEEVVAALKADGANKSKPAAGALANRSGRYLRLATELTSGEALLNAMRHSSVRQRALASVTVVPRTATERALVSLWEEILGTQGLGIDDDYFELGGTSLQAARMFAEIAHRRGAKLALTTIVEAPTVRLLAVKVDGVGGAAGSGLVPLKRSGSRPLFLVHDGDGETLLYRNIAHRAPHDVSVWGIQPARLKGVPLAHLRIEDMAAAYLKLVREQQPTGPYLLGGMCAGGLIAYEMAQQLQRSGESVEQVLMLDSATPQAGRRADLVSSARASRLRSAIDDAKARHRGAMLPLAIAGVVGRKAYGVLSYKIAHAIQRVSERSRMKLLGYTLAARKDWPAFVPSLDFRAIYNHAERRYVPPPNPQTSAVLVRALEGEGNDVPYVRVFNDPSLGWATIVGKLTIADTAGGHSSMLQEPNAAALAEVLRPYIHRTVA